MGYFILFIISLIFIAYTSTLIGLYASDTITFNPDTSNWVWLSLGVAGMFGCFGMYLVAKSAFSGSSTKIQEQIKEEPETGDENIDQEQEQPLIQSKTQYQRISPPPKEPLTGHYKQMPTRTPRPPPSSNYGAMPKQSEYGQLSLSPSEYDVVPSHLIKSEYNKSKKPIKYDDKLPGFEVGENLELPGLLGKNQ